MINRLIIKMMEWEKNCPKRIHHFLKVLAFSEQIATMEGLDDSTKEVIRVAALVHDIGIKPALEKYGSSAGVYQEKEGPDPARELLKELGYDERLINRVAYLVANHHSYEAIEGWDYQILVEAGFLVNVFEGNISSDQAHSIRDKIFKTPSGIEIFNLMY